MSQRRYITIDTIYGKKRRMAVFINRFFALHGKADDLTLTHVPTGRAVTRCVLPPRIARRIVRDLMRAYKTWDFQDAEAEMRLHPRRLKAGKAIVAKHLGER